MLEDSENGVVKSCDPEIKLLGAVNRGNVSCYLDTTLFAMFARLDSFEAMLFKTFEDEKKRRLATLLRLWVNTVRGGKLVTTDITKQLQESLAACGWAEAGSMQQQDASEAFSFITEKLELPMLTLKMHIFHTGKEDEKDDHKIVQERLLEVAIPEQPAEGEPPITLEACLETYFNSRIEVKRYLERRATLSSVRSRRRSVDSSKVQALHIEATEVSDSQPSTPSTNPPNILPPYSQVRPSSLQHRSPSIIQEHTVLDEKAIEAGFAPDCPSPAPGERPRAKSMRKEVLMPAWQFFSLIPWYTDASPTNDEQVAAHFRSKRPMLGICLKRYLMQNNGESVRRSTYIDIPTEIGLPHFIHDDTMEDDGPAFGNFKLSLQSAVCHRGTTISGGHYVCLARGNDSSGRETWLLFDDLSKGDRVQIVDIEKALRDESPYLLFYQVQPIEGDQDSTSDGDRPPSYASDLQDTTPTASGSPEGGKHILFADNTDFVRASLESNASGRRNRYRTIERDDPRPAGHREPDGNGQIQHETFAEANGHLAATTAPISISRKNSKRGKNGKTQASNQGNNDRRLSASLTRLTGMITGANRSENGVNDASGEATISEQPPEPIAENGAGTTDPVAPPEEKKIKKSKRGKSREKSRPPKEKQSSDPSKPDRECSIM